MARRRLRRGAASPPSLLVGLAGGAALPQESSADAPAARDRFRWPLRGPIVHNSRAATTTASISRRRSANAVHAAADGVCIYAGDDMKTYGKLVLIRHADGYVTAYADNSELDVKEGDPVKRGQIIAKSGDSGDGQLAAAAFRTAQGRQADRPDQISGSALGRFVAARPGRHFRARFMRFQSLAAPFPRRQAAHPLAAARAISPARRVVTEGLSKPVGAVFRNLHRPTKISTQRPCSHIALCPKIAHTLEGRQRYHKIRFYGSKCFEKTDRGARPLSTPQLAGPLGQCVRTNQAGRK